MHILVVLLKLLLDVVELLVSFGHLLLKRLEVGGVLALSGLVYRRRRTNTGYDVFALGVDEILAEELLFAVGRVAREGHAGGGGVAHVAEDHGLNVGGGTPLVGDALNVAVGYGALAVPALEHGAYAALELLHGIVGEGRFEDFFDAYLELFADLLEVGDGHVGVALVSLTVLELVHNTFELLADAVVVLGFDTFGLLHDDVRIHHHEAAVGVVDEALILGFRDKARYCFRAKADV